MVPLRWDNLLSHAHKISAILAPLRFFFSKFLTSTRLPGCFHSHGVSPTPSTQSRNRLNWKLKKKQRVYLPCSSEFSLFSSRVSLVNSLIWHSLATSSFLARVNLNSQRKINNMDYSVKGYKMFHINLTVENQLVSIFFEFSKSRYIILITGRVWQTSW